MPQISIEPMIPHNIEVAPLTTDIQNRRSSRDRQAPKWMKDFVSLNISSDVQYLMCNYISCSHLSPAYLVAISILIEPTTYLEAVKDKR